MNFLLRINNNHIHFNTVYPSIVNGGWCLKREYAEEALLGCPDYAMEMPKHPL